LRSAVGAGAVSGMTLTPYADLDRVVTEIAGHAADVLGDDFVGAYIEGSFALGAGDPYSDVDFIVVMKTPLVHDLEGRLRAFHRELPTRQEHWAQHVEGSYALLDDLLDPTRTGREWPFIDHGQRELTWDTHGNDMVHRWVLREHGIVVAGPSRKPNWMDCCQRFSTGWISTLPGPSAISSSTTAEFSTLS
jgi:predicted nucleotidyltransferase